MGDQASDFLGAVQVNKERKRWCIDGRDTEMCAGTVSALTMPRVSPEACSQVIQITFQFRSSLKSCDLCKCPAWGRDF